jgi:hypothetical protein
MLLSPGNRRLPSTFRAGVIVRVEPDDGAADEFICDKESSPSNISETPRNIEPRGTAGAFHFGTIHSKPEISSYPEPIPSWKLCGIASPYTQVTPTAATSTVVPPRGSHDEAQVQI